VVLALRSECTTIMRFALSLRHGLIMHTDRAPTSYQFLHRRAFNMRAPDQVEVWATVDHATLPGCTSLRVKPSATWLCRCGSRRNAAYQRMAKGPGAEVEHTELVSKTLCALLESARFFSRLRLCWLSQVTKDVHGVGSLVKWARPAQLLPSIGHGINQHNSQVISTLNK
jgi:hypothetical protein